MRRVAVLALILGLMTPVRAQRPVISTDVISSGTPDGVGAGRTPQEFLKPGDLVSIEIDGIGMLRTPMRAAALATR